MASTIGSRIKDLRLQRRMTQDELAKLSNTTKQTIYKYENDIVTDIPLSRLSLIAVALNVTEGQLMGWTPMQRGKTLQELNTEETLLLFAFRTAPESMKDGIFRLLNISRPLEHE